jgi:hypothetical protein
MGSDNPLRGHSVLDPLFKSTQAVKAGGTGTARASMAPTILAKDGKLFMVTGSPGGRTIINTVLETILAVDWGARDTTTPAAPGAFRARLLRCVLYFVVVFLTALPLKSARSIAFAIA